METLLHRLRLPILLFKNAGTWSSPTPAEVPINWFVGKPSFAWHDSWPVSVVKNRERGKSNINIPWKNRVIRYRTGFSRNSTRSVWLPLDRGGVRVFWKSFLGSPRSLGLVSRAITVWKTGTHGVYGGKKYNIPSDFLFVDFVQQHTQSRHGKLALSHRFHKYICKHPWKVFRPNSSISFTRPTLKMLSAQIRSRVDFGGTRVRGQHRSINGVALRDKHHANSFLWFIFFISTI